MDVREMMTLADAGLLEGRFELVDGELIEMPAQGNAHGVAVNDLYDALRPRWARPKFIRNQTTHRFSEHEAPEPDLVLLDAYPVAGATVDAPPRLVIEVSDSTLATDLGRKKRDYARFDVPEYWVLDLQGQRLFVFREPNREATDIVHAWRDERIFTADGEASPLCVPSMTLKVADLLPATSGESAE